MTSLFDDYLLSQPGKPREPGIYYVADLTKGCLLQAYLDKGVLLQGSDRNGGSQVDRCFTVQRDPVIFMTFITRCRELSQFVNAKTAPDAASPDWFCNYCLHREGCRVAEGGNKL